MPLNLEICDVFWLSLLDASECHGMVDCAGSKQGDYSLELRLPRPRTRDAWLVSQQRWLCTPSHTTTQVLKSFLSHSKNCCLNLPCRMMMPDTLLWHAAEDIRARFSSDAGPEDWDSCTVPCLPMPESWTLHAAATVLRKEGKEAAAIELEKLASHASGASSPPQSFSVSMRRPSCSSSVEETVSQHVLQSPCSLFESRKHLHLW
jgi:hypothetical protein